MSTTYKFKVLVNIKDEHGTSRSISPIIEASEHEARQIAEAQYPNGDVRSASKIN
jgi:hypothetical protein